MTEQENRLVAELRKCGHFVGDGKSHPAPEDHYCSQVRAAREIERLEARLAEVEKLQEFGVRFACGWAVDRTWYCALEEDQLIGRGATLFDAIADAVRLAEEAMASRKGTPNDNPN